VSIEFLQYACTQGNEYSLSVISGVPAGARVVYFECGYSNFAHGQNRVTLYLEHESFQVVRTPEPGECMFPELSIEIHEMERAPIAVAKKIWRSNGQV